MEALAGGKRHARPQGEYAEKVARAWVPRPSDRRDGADLADRAATGTEQPLGHADALGVALSLQRPSREVVVVASDPTDPLRTTARDARRPGTVLALVTPDQAVAWTEAGFELFEGRDTLDPAGYVCHDRVCALAARTSDELDAQLA